MTSALIAAAFALAIVSAEWRRQRKQPQSGSREAEASPLSARNSRDVAIVILAVAGLIVGFVGIAGWKSLG